MQVVGSALCLRSGSEDRALVALQDAEPVREIVGVIGHGFRRDAKISAQERRAHFGDQLFRRIGRITEPLAEGAV